MLAGALVESRTQTSPRQQMACAGEYRHVGTDLGKQDNRRRRADAGDGHQPRNVGVKGREQGLDASLKLSHGVLELLDRAQVLAEQEAVVLADGALERLRELRSRAAQPCVPQLGERLGIRLPIDQCTDDAASTN